jgi:hypothetical protein
MNQAYFITKKALFGGYPNHNTLTELQQEGVTWFVDLTNSNEKNTTTYSDKVNNWVNYPIKDGDVPKNKKKFMIFLILIQLILESLKPGEKIYLHCRGGHGRTSLVIACFLGFALNLPSQTSLNLARTLHNNKQPLNSKWLNKWPLNLKQRMFVENFFGKLNLKFHFPYTNDIKSKVDFIKYFIKLNFYVHQHPFILEILLNSGLKTINDGDKLLQELRLFILYNQAKKLLC